jgi:N6-L-threonylcarbamoyladenine synthase
LPVRVETAQLAAAVPEGESIMTRPFLTLGIESSCDDTAVAVLSGRIDILASSLSSQIKFHSEYGGVVPELASRMHQEAILPLIEKVLKDAGVKSPKNEIGLIAVTAGPGLMGSLLVGVMTAKGLSAGWDVPLIGVNHLEGHIFANVLAHKGLEPPFISAIVSGGHTELVMVRAFGDYLLMGSTRDDAAGEAYDKLSKTLGLGYPGGPVIDRLAEKGNEEAYKLPLPLANTSEIEFSFSGLKTAAINTISKLEMGGEELNVPDICASFRKAVTDSLTRKISLAIEKSGVKKVALSGGVAANSHLRRTLSDMAEHKGWSVYLPPLAMCTDNASMIAAAGYSAWSRGVRSDLSLSPDPSWEIWKSE